MQKLVNDINVGDDLVMGLGNIATQTNDSINNLTENIKISQYEFHVKGIFKIY